MNNLSVVIPAYNEEENIKDVIKDINRELPGSEIIIVDDKSTDNTALILKHYPEVRTVTNKINSGHGKTILRGLKMATREWILYIDADRQINLNHLRLFKQPHDFFSGIRINRHDKLFRKIISFCLKMTNVIFHRLYIRDANCPFKLYRREALFLLLERVPETAIIPIACLEVLARKAGFRTIEIEVLHEAYHSERKGFLQSINLKSLQFFYSAFKEITSI